MNIVDFKKGVEGKRKVAFVIFYCLKSKPWKNHREPDKEFINLNVPTCLVINRWDGMMGFIGGKVESDESLEEAVRREVFEEIGHKLVIKLEPIVAHDIGPITSHAFAAKVTYPEILHIQRDAALSEDFGSEITGSALPHLIDYDSATKSEKGGIVELYKGSMAPSMREELTHFLLKKKIFSRKELKDICARAGYDLDELIS